MCGITGCVALGGGAPDLGLLRRMTGLLAHRGPDGDGFWNEGPAAFGHRRLAIIDLSPAGAQPMADATGRYVVTYNGEIYNYVELRSELEAAGSTFRTRSDTEVLLEAYARWGPPCVERFNGMFAFALWDRKERTLFAARDRFGEKPFFYRYVRGEGFWFASEPRALFRAGVLPPTPRRDALFRFLAFRQTGTHEDTFFEGLAQIPPAHTLMLRDGRLEFRRYWSLPEEPVPAAGTETEQAARIAELLQDSVRVRLRSDVPVGTCLSGGLDSSSVVAMVARALRDGAGGAATPGPVTFTACFPDSPEDETRHVESMVAFTGVESNRVVPTAVGMLDELPRLLEAQGEPFSGPSIYAEWKVMELARSRNVVVLLNGQGGDEVFGGYLFFFGDAWWELLSAGRFLEARREMRAFDAIHGQGAARAILGPALRSRVPYWVRRLKGGPSVPWLETGFVREQAAPHAPRPSGLRGSLRDSQSHRMLPHLLRQADRDSMAFSREARLPLLDHRLVEYVDSLPDQMKLRGGTTKWAMREAIRGLVPESIRGRHDKVGFALPMAKWLREGCLPAVRDTFGSRSFRERGFFDLRGVGEQVDRLAAGDDRAAVPVWNCFLAEHWLRVCVDSGGPQR